MQTTIKEMANTFSINGIIPNKAELGILLKFAQASGEAKVAGHEPNFGRKGRPGIVWEISNNLNFKIVKRGKLMPKKKEK